MSKLKSKWQKAECDRCGFTYKRKQLKRQRGILVCDECCDARNIKPVYPKWRSERVDSDTYTAVTEPVVYDISASGITSLSQSLKGGDGEDDGLLYHYTMYVQGDGGAVTMDNIIDAPAQGHVLTLRGNSDSKPLTITESPNLQLLNSLPCTLKEGDTINFVFKSEIDLGGWGIDWGLAWGSAVSDAWMETSRHIGGV